jgi:mannose-6-phosphate isomerase-like protein (cupin superfamily)
MKEKRIVLKGEASEKKVGGSVVREYFMQQVPNLGLATALIEGVYPPEGEGTWSINERVDEMHYVVDGTARIVYKDGLTFKIEPQSAVYIPRSVKYRLEDAKDLRIVIATGPAWSADQHKWSSG